jgi:hypothetical protein
MFTVQTDETCYRIVSPHGDESATAEYGEPAILVCSDAIYYCQMGPDDEEATVFKVTNQESVETSTEEVEFDEEGEDEDEEEEEEEAGVIE